MPTKSKTRAKSASIPDQVAFVLKWLRNKSTQRDVDNLKRFAVTAKKAMGVSLANIRVLAKQLGKSHDLAAALWATGWYEARILASFVDEPERVTPAQMDRWCRDFDNWGICDTVCFCLFDRTPHAWIKVKEWSTQKGEYQKRTAFALLWSLTTHDKSAADRQFIDGLTLIEQSAGDDRNFVKKAVNMALRAIGKRNVALHAAAIKTAQRLAASPEPAARWNGKDALRELNSESVAKRLAAKRRKSKQ